MFSICKRRTTFWDHSPRAVIFDPQLKDVLFVDLLFKSVFLPNLVMHTSFMRISQVKGPVFWDQLLPKVFAQFCHEDLFFIDFPS